MAWTSWLTANTITKFDNDEVVMDINHLISLSPLHGVLGDYGRIVHHGSEALLFKNFNVSGTATAIEALIHVDRASRIQDKVIQLYNGSSLVGKNRADLTAVNKWTYSWTNISYSLSSDFGLVIDYQPNVSIPSSERLIIRTVSLRFDI
tara:strand:+ start:76 stop:522 length:447 start_codon:yes stop_codon:yes gene_type:complete